MGKIRVKTLGDSEKEKQQKIEAKKRKEAKKADKEDVVVKQPELKTQQPEDKKTEKKKTKHASTGKKRSATYQAAAALVDKKRVYSVHDALLLLPQLKRTHFDESVELHMTTDTPGVTVSTQLPHGTGKAIRVAIADEALIAAIEKGHIDFDILVAEPSMMPKLAKVAKILGPKGLMPNPKNGTISPKPDEVVKKFQGGQIHFKTEAKFPLLHLTIGKVSFGDTKLSENLKAIAQVLPPTQVKHAMLKLTMSPPIAIDYTSI